MAFGMATRKVTITLEDEQLAAVRALVASGKAENVSSFVKHAVAVSLADVAGWAETLASALAETGGALTRKERAWADSVLRPARVRRKRRRTKAA
jgi:Arc/MetJ-type ribon-helix-helix transcriptional regulator